MLQGISTLPWSYMSSKCFPYGVNPHNVNIATLDTSAHRKIKCRGEYQQISERNLEWSNSFQTEVDSSQSEMKHLTERKLSSNLKM